MRAARTDAGVSAAINVLNLKLILNPSSLPPSTSLEDHINTFLPRAVRAWSIIRVQGGFHSRTMCDSRMYNYSLPTYCFLEPKEETVMGKRVAWKQGEKANGYWNQQNQKLALNVREAAKTSVTMHSGDDQSGETPLPARLLAPHNEPQKVQAKESIVEHPEIHDVSISDPAPSTTFAVDQVHRKAYRMPDEVLYRARETVSEFSGSHNFWNFTVGKEFGDRSCQRVMKNLTVSDPFMVGNSEWISLKFHGQSFMLHQIRKMIGLVIMVVRTRTPASLVPETFGPARLNIPKAPALGLLLEQPRIDSYNRKVADLNAHIAHRSNASSSIILGMPTSPEIDSSVPNTPVQQSDSAAAGEASDLTREPVSYDAIDEAVERFKKEVIVKGMLDEEEKSDTYAKWLNLHDNQLGKDFEYVSVSSVMKAQAKVFSAIISLMRRASFVSHHIANCKSYVLKSEFVITSSIRHHIQEESPS